MITYKTLWPELPNVKVPVLHKIVYGYAESFETYDEWNLKDQKIRLWCQNMCSAPFYFHPGYTRKKFIQFEDDRDAVLFALWWA